MKKSIGVAIVGGTGYGAGELLRLLTQHPQAEVVSVVSSSSAGRLIEEAHPHLTGFYPLKFDGALDLGRLTDFTQRVVFLALPHGASAAVAANLAAELEQKDALLIDLSGDFRLADQTLRTHYYPAAAVHAELQSKFVYGLSELNRELIRGARFLSAPGCLAAVSILGLAPLVVERSRGHAGVGAAATPVISGTVAVDLKTGTSGAGKGLSDSFHHPSRHANSTPYKVLQHRHEPEVLQALCDPFAERTQLSLVPHLIPASRGCSATIHAELQDAVSTDELLQRYRDFYAGHPFIRIRTTPPEWQTVVGTNFCDIHVVARERRVVAMSALDNLVKGTAGQAIQNMNLVFGLDETAGLWAPALGPCTPLL